jgi:cation diffusion facilitator family transporter
MMAVDPGYSGRKAAALLSLVVGAGMLVGKWTAYAVTGSHAILSDALESVVHIVATAFALASIIVSARPPDPKYPYGYGKISYFSAGFEGGLIVLAALAILYEAGEGLMFGVRLRKIDVGLVLILLASLINLALGLWLIRQGKESGSLILEADGHHVLADSYTSFGVVAGVGLVWLTDWQWLDPLVAILVAFNILRTGYALGREAFTGLMDRADPALLAKIVGALQAGRQSGWKDVHQLRAWQSGDRIFVDLHLVVPKHWTVGQLHEAIDQCGEILKSAFGPATEVIIHFDPDRPGQNRYDEEAPFTLETAVRTPANDDEHDCAREPAIAPARNI